MKLLGSRLYQYTQCCNGNGILEMTTEMGSSLNKIQWTSVYFLKIINKLCNIADKNTTDPLPHMRDIFASAINAKCVKVKTLTYCMHNIYYKSKLMFFKVSFSFESFIF